MHGSIPSSVPPSRSAAARSECRANAPRQGVFSGINHCNMQRHEGCAQGTRRRAAIGSCRKRNGRPLWKLVNSYVLQTSSPNNRKGPISAETTLERQLDPQHGMRFEKTGIPQRPSVDDLKAERSDQLDDSRLIRCVIASYEHHRLNAVKERIGHIAETGGIECFEYRGACGPCLYLLAGRTVVTDFQTKPVSSHCNWVARIKENFAREVAHRANGRLGRIPWCGQYNKFGKTYRF